MVEWIGAAAGFLTTASFIPQAVKIIRERQTAGISLVMYASFTFGVFLWLIYGLCIGSPSVIIANIVTVLLAGAVLILKLSIDYGPTRNRPRRRR